MTGTRLRNMNWAPGNAEGGADNWEQAKIAILLDIRDELQRIRGSIECPNVRKGFIAMQQLNHHIKAHGAKPAPKRAKK